jgi:hypothetical protein
VILGKGLINLPHAFSLIQKARPATRMTLEMITRDPLKIALLGEEYWTTFPDSTAKDLARILHFVNRNRSGVPLPRVSDSTEDENIRRCLEASIFQFKG